MKQDITLLIFGIFIGAIGTLIIIFISLLPSANATEVKQPMKPCLVCLKTYQACTKKVNQSIKPDEDAVLECEDKYYACFFKHTCQNEGQR